MRYNFEINYLFYYFTSFRDELHYVNLNLIISYENLYNLIIITSSFIHVQCIITFSTKSPELIFVLRIIYLNWIFLINCYVIYHVHLFGI